MATVRDVVTDALTELGVLADGETAPAGNADLGLRALNRLVDQWAAVKLLIYSASVRNAFAIVASQATYSVGTGGSPNIARPIFVQAVNYRDSEATETEYPLQSLTDDGWAGVANKTLTATVPTHWYYRPTYPLAELKLWPLPTRSDLFGLLYAPQAVTEFASLDTTISLPPGYREMIVTNLAVRLAPSFEREPNAILIAQAQASMAVVKRSNVRVSDMSFEAAALIGGGGGSYSIRRG